MVPLDGDTPPTPLLMFAVSAPAILHDNVADPPSLIVPGFAEKLLMTGSDGLGCTVTVTVRVTEPPALLAVRV